MTTLSGGTIRTQDKLRAGHFTPEVLDQLAEEAADHQEPIKHEWYSLPEVCPKKDLLNLSMIILQIHL